MELSNCGQGTCCAVLVISTRLPFSENMTRFFPQNRNWLSLNNFPRDGNEPSTKRKETTNPRIPEAYMVVSPIRGNPNMDSQNTIVLIIEAHKKAPSISSNILKQKAYPILYIYIYICVCMYIYTYIYICIHISTPPEPPT